MNTFTLTLLSRNYSQIIELDLPLTILPRVGEIIEASELLPWEKDYVTTFFVLSVSYRATEKGLLPFVKARQWYKGFRHEELQNRGWLMPDRTDTLSYDEMDFYPDKAE